MIIVDKLVSIIMPCHNGEKFIKNSIESVINQTYKNWELIIINDNSTDSSVDIIQSFAKKDSRIKMINNSTPVGKPYLPRNLGIAESKGVFIAFLDCDDIWLPTKLEKQIFYFDYDDCAVVFSYYKKMDNEGDVRSSIIKSPQKVSYRNLLNGNCIGNLTGMYDVEKVGKIYQKDFGHEDYLMWLEILKQGYYAYCTCSVEAIYREQIQSVSGNKYQAFKWTWKIFRYGINLSFMSSIFHFIIYAFKGIIKFIK